jgi:peptidoglycan/LPS O-acetylase OafA/YrhL
MALALLSTTRRWERVSAASGWLAPLAFVAGVGMYAAVCAAWPREATSSLNLAYLPIAALLLLPALLTGSSWLSRPLGNPVFAWLGVVSYGIYLWHSTLITVAGRHTSSHAAAGLLGLAATLAAAAASYYVVEAPFLRMKRRAARS